MVSFSNAKGPLGKHAFELAGSTSNPATPPQLRALTSPETKKIKSF
jgi:hypothetical protein